MTRRLCGLVLAGTFLAVHSLAATYFVATNGNDSNPGTQRAPFRHLSKGAAAARQPGDTVIVMDGTYDNEGRVAQPGGGGSVVTMNYSGTDRKPITFRAQNRGKAILDAMNTSTALCNGAWAYFDLRDSSYIVIQGFVIQGGCYNGIRSNDNAHDITIRWNEIRNIGNWANPGGSSSPSGIFINSGEYNFTFDGNIFHDIGGATPNQEQAIYTAATNVAIINNVFYNLTHGWGVQTAGGTNILIANNTFAFPNPNRTGQLMLWDGRGAGSLSNVTIRNNIFYNPVGVAVVTDLAGEIGGGCTIDHNITTARSIVDNGSSCTLDSNRTNTDPKLVNASVAPYDFHVQRASPAIATGIPIPNLARDCDGAARPAGSTSDIGAFTSLAPVTRPIAAIENGASFFNAPIAPGEVISIFGLGIGPPGGASLTLDASGMVNTMLSGSRVLFDGTAAPMIYTSDVQVTAIVPYAVAGQSTTRLEIEFNGTKSQALDIDVADSAPGIFTMNFSGQGQGCILNQDSSLNSAADPAARGSIIAIYATGAGQTDPSGVDGLVAGSDLNALALPVFVTIGGQNAEVIYAGSAPGSISGILQINARVPTSIPAGNAVPVVLTVGNNSSAPGVTMAVL